MFSSEICDSESIRILLEHGANPDIQINGKIRDLYIQDETALMISSQKCDSKSIKILLENGANPNIQTHYTNTINDEDIRGQTALMISAEKKDSNSIKLLLEHGAIPDIQGMGGKYLFCIMHSKCYVMLLCIAFKE